MDTKIIIYFCLLFLINSSVKAENRPLKVGAFQVTHSLTLPGSPEALFDQVSGDISGWWDHSMSEKPLKFYLEPKPGGGFYEIFDEAGNGVKHAEVIYAQRGKLLRFVGPLGLSGNAITLVTSYQFESMGNDSVRVNVTVNASGQMEEGWAETVDRVWYHFHFERLKPYVEKLQHK
ncbi:MAG: SRPBCC domain-containing protein [Calditrichae bacterium]|nr:SRPBCC domain-containing protein [Calditrichia bacterium]